MFLKNLFLEPRSVYLTSLFLSPAFEIDIKSPSQACSDEKLDEFQCKCISYELQDGNIAAFGFYVDAGDEARL